MLCLVTQSCPTLRNPMDCTVHGILQAITLEWYPFSSPGDLPNPRTEPRSPALRADSSPAEPQGKPKNTGTGSLSVLQQIFPTQESNWGLMHCRQILYQLSYQGSPRILEWVAYPLLQQIFLTQESNCVSCIAGRFFTN